MASANIKINGIAASNDDLPINTLVTLDNANTGGELTYNWVLLDQPPGPADVLSSAVIQNPTFTPKKEGTYLLKLTVNQSLVSEVSDTKIVGIRQLKTRERVPAAGETTQDGVSRGWAGASGSFLQRVDASAADRGLAVGVVATGAPNVNVGNVLRTSSTEIIKSGLPGQESVAGWQRTDALTIAAVDQMLSVCVGAVDGSAGPYAPGKLIQIRIFGLITGFAGVPAAVGDPVYVSDAGVVVVTPGTITRQIGNVVRFGGGTFDAWIDGTFGSSIALATGAPVNVTKAAAAAGTATSAARSDHKHDITTAAAVSLATTSTNAEGVATSLARSDHTHAVAVGTSTLAASAGSNFTTGAQQQVGGGAYSIALAAGTWLLMFSCRYVGGSNNSISTFQFRTGASFGASAVITNTQRDVSTSPAADSRSVCMQTVITTAATTLFVGGTTTAGTVTVNDRELTAVRLF